MGKIKFRLKFNHKSDTLEEVRNGRSRVIDPYGRAWRPCSKPTDKNPSMDENAITLWPIATQGNEALEENKDRICRYVYHNGNWYHVCSQ